MSQPPSVLTAPRLWDLVADGYAREIAPHLAKYADDCIFGLCGVSNVERQNFGVIVTSTPAQRRAWLEQVRATVARHFPREG